MHEEMWKCHILLLNYIFMLSEENVSDPAQNKAQSWVIAQALQSACVAERADRPKKNNTDSELQ